MDPENPNQDANTSVESSTTENQPAVESQQTTNEPAAEPTLSDVARDAYETGTSSQEADDGGVQNKDKTEVEEPVADDEKPATEDATDEVPFHDHPRWQEVTKQNKDLSAKVTEMTEQTKQYEDYAKRVQYHDAFMESNGIEQNDFNQMMNILSLRNADPAKARELLKPIWDSLSAFDENVIPLDVQQKINKVEQAVKESEISRALADEQIALLKDSAKARVLNQANARRTKMTTEQQQRAVAQSIGTTLQSWESSTAKKDPSFKPKAANARDGVYELTCAKYAFLANMKMPRNAAEASALVEQAYKEAKEVLTPARATQQRPNLTSARSSTAKVNGDQSTIAGTVAAVARKHGYSWSPKR